MNTKNKGFTLLEILLVIALMGILIGILLVAINPNRQLGQARNLTRKKHITDIYNALELQKVKNKGVILNTITTSYQEICDTGVRSTTDALPSTSYCDGKIDLRVLVPTYITSIPKDNQATGTASTGYEVAKINTNQIITRAKNPELGETIIINMTASSTTVSDPYWSNVSLLMKFDGTNGGTTFTDNSDNALSISRFGDSQISTAQGKFNQSLYLDGTGDYLQIPQSNLFLFDANFTVEMWYYETSRGTYSTPLEIGNILSVSGIMFRTGTADGGIFIGGTKLGTGSYMGNQNTWNHIAVVRSSNIVTGYVNGVSIGTGTISQNIGASSGQIIYLGQSVHAGSRFFTGYIDEFRVTKGVARYTANFTPPTVSFPTN